MIATVGDAELTESDAYVLMKHSGFKYDDKKARKEFVNSWCEFEVYKQELKANHPDEWKLVELRAAAFQGDLSKYYLEEINVRKKLDTIVSTQELKEYYDKHLDEFLLKDHIVKG